MFQNSILAGTALVRPAIHSPNYVTGVSGWTINQDGTAEFLDLTIRGEFSTGPPGSQRVVINDSGAGGLIRLFSGDPDEVLPGFLLAFSSAATGNDPWIDLGGADIGFGRLHVIIIPSNGSDNSAQVVIAGNQVGRGVLQLNPSVAIMAAGMRPVSASDAGSFSTTSTTFVPVGGTTTGQITYPPSGAVMVTLDNAATNNVAANYAAMSVEIRDTNAAGTIRVAASTNHCTSQQSGNVNDSNTNSTTRIFTGLPTSGIMFFRCMMLSSNVANTANFIRPGITVTPLP